MRIGDSYLNSTHDDLNAVTKDIIKKMPHPSWRYDNPLYYDVGIWEIRPVTFNKAVRTICLPGASDPTIDKYLNQFGTLAGKL